MRILFDDNVPAFLAERFRGHQVTTVPQEGWAGIDNVNLLSSAERSGYRLLITLDKGFLRQRGYTDRAISVAVLVPRERGRNAIAKAAALLRRQLNEIFEGDVLLVTTVD